MKPIDDRLSRIAALRPRSPIRFTGRESASNSEKLIRLLGGERRENSLGGHIRVRNRFMRPAAGAMDPGSLKILEPDFADPLYDPGQWLFLDTETTGLAGGTGTYAFLVGLAWWEEGAFTVEQYFMRDYCDEASLLLEVAGRLSERRVLVTYNGKSFDWPLLQTRFQMGRVCEIPKPSLHLDLLHPARQIWRLSLESVALEQLEKHILKFDRGRDIPSATIPWRYFDFLRGGPPEEVAEVFHHNCMDLCGLATLAVHIVDMLASPQRGVCRPEELFGISRMFRKRGEARIAAQICREALAGGLPKEAERAAQRELAILAARERDFELSNRLWEKLLDGSVAGLQAYERLAVHYEHRASLPHKAARLSREALVRLQESFRSGSLASKSYLQWHRSFSRRLARLERKVSGVKSTGT